MKKHKEKTELFVPESFPKPVYCANITCGCLIPDNVPSIKTVNGIYCDNWCKEDSDIRGYERLHKCKYCDSICEPILAKKEYVYKTTKTKIGHITKWQRVCEDCKENNPLYRKKQNFNPIKKIHLCVICGESKKENFYATHKSKCKKCKNKIHRNYIIKLRKNKNG